MLEDLDRALAPIEQRPCVVAGIESARHTTRAGTPYVVIHNPAAHTYRELDPREHDLLPGRGRCRHHPILRCAQDVKPGQVPPAAAKGAPPDPSLRSG